MNLLLSVAVAFLGAWVWILSSHGLPQEQLDALQLIHRQIGEEHVEPPDSNELMWAAIEGMVSRCDEHSDFIQPAELAAFEEDTTGRYQGIGIVMATVKAPVVIKFPFANGPSERAGLHVGDRILAVDGEPLEAETSANLHAAARRLLLGPEGTTVTLLVERDGESPFETSVTRGSIHKPSVKWVRMLDAERGIGYLYLKGFQNDSAEEFREALNRLDELAGGKMKGLVIDLRFNRGGLLDEAIPIANVFLPGGTIVSLKRRSSEVIETHEADPALCTRPDLPVVLLVDHGSASASEVVAGALQDHERATVVGVRTYGKGVVQSIYRWKDLDFRLKLTTAHYYTPNGRSIEGNNRRAEDGEAEGGIEPDRVARVNKEEWEVLRTNLYAANEPPERYRDQVRALCEKLGFTYDEPPGPDDDPQLAASLEEIRRIVAEANPSK